MNLIIFKVLLICSVLAFAKKCTQRKCKEEYCTLMPPRDINNEEIADIDHFFWTCSNYDDINKCYDTNMKFENETLKFTLNRREYSFTRADDCIMKERNRFEYSVLYFKKEEFCIGACDPKGPNLIVFQCFSKKQKPSQDLKDFADTIKKKGLVNEVFFLDANKCDK